MMTGIDMFIKKKNWIFLREIDDDFLKRRGKVKIGIKSSEIRTGIVKKEKFLGFFWNWGGQRELHRNRRTENSGVYISKE